jgi:hypothetical protein
MITEREAEATRLLVIIDGVKEERRVAEAHEKRRSDEAERELRTRVSPHGRSLRRSRGSSVY